MKLNAVISEMTDEELRDSLAEQAEALSKLRMNHAVSVLENPLQIRDARRKVARLHTEQKKRQQAAQNK